MHEQKVIISVQDLVKNYGSFQAVKGISFDVYEGEIFGLLGPNGAGKSTTLEIIETLREKTSGQVVVNGHDIDKAPNEIKKIIGVQLQTSGFYPNLLDPQARRNLWDLIRDIRGKGTTVIITTHYMDEAEYLCDRVAIVDSGQIVALNSPDGLIDELVDTGFERPKEMKRANLEDVFINLTGHSLRET
ncbi:MAG: ABC transporter ATP-binding protein [Chitinophagaceae bacterium]|nr:MAG: ABC transporter ATP-binding protein [Chitinophagaceae bacterium]